MKLYFLPILIIFILTFNIPTFSQEVLYTDELFKQMIRAYGFCEGQSFTLKRIQKEFPELQNLAKIAEYEWSGSLGDSCDFIDTKFVEVIGENWKLQKENLIRVLTNSLGNNPITKEEALAFIEVVKNRAKGETESPEIPTLLIFKTEFQENPIIEMSKGFIKKYRTENHPKAKGIDFQIKYPMSWQSEEGERPNIIQKFISKRDGTIIMLLVKDIPTFNGRKINAKEKDLVFTEAYIKEFVPNGAIFVDFKPITLDSQKGAMLIYDQIAERLDLKLKTRSVNFITIYNNKMIFITGFLAIPNDSKDQLNQKYKKLEPLFKLIANSFVLQNQYK